MAHEQQFKFTNRIKSHFPDYFHNTKVVDFGSLDINGSNKVLFEDCEYTGVDLGKGKNVDVISLAHEFQSDNNVYGTVISTEMLEHDPYYQRSLTRMYDVLRPSGLMLITCATTGRPEHGTLKTSPQDSPFTSGITEMQHYYKNITESDIREVWEIEELFSQHLFYIHNATHDLYFYGIKKGLK